MLLKEGKSGCFPLLNLQSDSIPQSMHKTGLLLVTKAVNQQRLSHLLQLAGQQVHGRLYLCLEQAPLTPRTLSLCYSQPVPPSLDVRFLHADWPRHSRRLCDLLLHDDQSLEASQLAQLVSKYLVRQPEHSVALAACLEMDSSHSSIPDSHLSGPSEPAWHPDQFANVALGGTFDRLHSGHKILLATGALLASRMLTIGITGQSLLSRKLLADLIQSFEVRASAVIDFLSDTRPDGPIYHVTELTEPLGPPARQEDYQALVASQETLAGCRKINEGRVAVGWPELPVHCIPFAEETGSSGPTGESKVSSSIGRYRLLGSVLRPPLRPGCPGRPYVLGLTGGSGSGKSSVAKRLAGLGARVIDCDRLGHTAYAPGTTCHGRLIKEFGSDIVPEGPDGPIDRKSLGRLVFANPEARRRLNEIVWPEIRRAVEVELRDSSPGVVVLDAAVLLEAEWQCLCHEVWVCLVSRSEAARRLTERDGLSTEAAEARLAAQMTDAGRLVWASVALSTVWEPEVTQAQVEAAWRMLAERLAPQPARL